MRDYLMSNLLVTYYLLTVFVSYHDSYRTVRLIWFLTQRRTSATSLLMCPAVLKLRKCHHTLTFYNVSHFHLWTYLTAQFDCDYSSGMKKQSRQQRNVLFFHYEISCCLINTFKKEEIILLIKSEFIIQYKTNKQ